MARVHAHTLFNQNQGSIANTANGSDAARCRESTESSHRIVKDTPPELDRARALCFLVLV